MKAIKITKRMIRQMKRMGDASLTYFFFGALKTIVVMNRKDKELKRRYDIAKTTAGEVLQMEKEKVSIENPTYQKKLQMLEEEINDLMKWLRGRKLLAHLYKKTKTGGVK